MSFLTPYEVAASSTEAQIADSMGGRYGEGVYANRAEEYYVKSINDYLMLAKDMNYDLMNQLSSAEKEKIVIKPTQLIDPIDMVKRGRYYVQISYVYAETIDVERVKKVFENVTIALDNLINIYSSFAEIMRKGLNSPPLNEYLASSEAYNRMLDILIRMLPNNDDLKSVQQGDSYNAPKQNLNGYISNIRSKSITLMGLQLYVFDLAENRTERPFYAPISYGPLHSNPLGYYPLPGVSYFEVFNHDINFFKLYFDADSSIPQYSDYEYVEHDPKNVNSISSSMYLTSDYGVERKDVGTQVYYTYLVLRLFANMLHNNDLIEIRLDRVKGSGLFTINQEPWVSGSEVAAFSFDASFSNLCSIYKRAWDDAASSYSESILYEAQRNLAYIRRQTEQTKANAANSQLYNSGYINMIIFIDTFTLFNEALMQLNRSNDYEEYLESITNVFKTVYQNAVNQFGPSSGNRGSHTSVEDIKKRIQGLYSYSMSYITLGGFFEAIAAFDASILPASIERPDGQGNSIYDHTELRKRGFEGNEFVPAQGSFNMMLSLIAMGIYAMFTDQYISETRSKSRESALDNVQKAISTGKPQFTLISKTGKQKFALFGPIFSIITSIKGIINSWSAEIDDVITFKLVHLVDYINLIGFGYDPNVRQLTLPGGPITPQIMNDLGQSVVTREQFLSTITAPDLGTYLKTINEFIVQLTTANLGYTGKNQIETARRNMIGSLIDLNKLRIEILNVESLKNASSYVKAAISQLNITLCNILFAYSRMIFYTYQVVDDPNSKRTSLHITLGGLQPAVNFMAPITNINIPDIRGNEAQIGSGLIDPKTPYRTLASFKALANKTGVPYVPLGFEFWTTPDGNGTAAEEPGAEPAPKPDLIPQIGPVTITTNKPAETTETTKTNEIIPPKEPLNLSSPQSSNNPSSIAGDSSIISITPSTGPSDVSPAGKYKAIQQSTDEPEPNPLTIITETTYSVEEKPIDLTNDQALQDAIRFLAGKGITIDESEHIILYYLIDYLRVYGLSVDSERLTIIQSSADENLYFYVNPLEANGHENVVFRIFADLGQAPDLGPQMMHMFQQILDHLLGRESKLSTTSIISQIRKDDPSPIAGSVPELIEQVKKDRNTADTTIRSVADLLKAEEAQLAVIVGDAPELAESLKASIEINKEILILLRGIYLKYYPSLPGGPPGGGPPDGGPPGGGSSGDGSNDVPNIDPISRLLRLLREGWFWIKRLGEDFAWYYNLVTGTLNIIKMTATIVVSGLFLIGVAKYQFYSTFFNDHHTLTTNSTAIVKELQTSNSTMTSSLQAAKEYITTAIDTLVSTLNEVFEATVIAGKAAQKIVELGESTAKYTPYIVGISAAMLLGFIGYSIYKETTSQDVHVTGASSELVKEIQLRPYVPRRR